MIFLGLAPLLSLDGKGYDCRKLDFGFSSVWFSGRIEPSLYRLHEREPQRYNRAGGICRTESLQLVKRQRHTATRLGRAHAKRHSGGSGSPAIWMGRRLAWKGAFRRPSRLFLHCQPEPARALTNAPSSRVTEWIPVIVSHSPQKQAEISDHYSETINIFFVHESGARSWYHGFRARKVRLRIGHVTRLGI